jgi:hypothetical protein
MKRGKVVAAMTTELRRTRLAPASGKKAAGKAVAMRTAIRRKRYLPASPEQRARWDRMIGLGCVACRLNEIDFNLRRVSYLRTRTTVLCAAKLEIHHLLSGNKRMGHDFTVCLCRFHHQGDFLPVVGHPYAEQAMAYGPSVAHEGKRFREVYGREMALLAYQNSVLAAPPVVITAGIDTAEDRIQIYFEGSIAESWSLPDGVRP